MKYRELLRGEIDKLIQIDRTETIDSIYYMRNGNLVLEKEHHEIPDWTTEEKQERIKTLQNVYDQGATFFGAFVDRELVGMSVLNHNPLASGNSRLNLEGLWVSDQFRGMGVGKKLLQLAIQEALKRDARSLYVSAMPSRNTVQFYQKLGCELAERIDPDLYEKEPEDIHLELILIG